ncbi:MAG: selenium-binding family protein [Acidobacteria bacterium]|nr:selenium-binding family protein [Acidobacteriota bacterium]MCA1608058.1 selenium-binding family protein [Acidobacteriota bacterium]
MGLLSRLKRKIPIDPHIERRRLLVRTGRITDGRIIDTETDREGGEIVFYVYTLNGVDFESSELLSEEQRRDPLRYAPGAKVGIRYDPKNQGNSMLV